MCVCSCVGCVVSDGTGVGDYSRQLLPIPPHTVCVRVFACVCVCGINARVSRDGSVADLGYGGPRRRVVLGECG